MLTKLTLPVSYTGLTNWTSLPPLFPLTAMRYNIGMSQPQNNINKVTGCM